MLALRIIEGLPEIQEFLESVGGPAPSQRKIQSVTRFPVHFPLPFILVKRGKLYARVPKPLVGRQGYCDRCP